MYKLNHRNILRFYAFIIYGVNISRWKFMRYVYMNVIRLNYFYDCMDKCYAQSQLNLIRH